MARQLEVTNEDFDRIWEEEMLPDLNRRHDGLNDAVERARDTSKFLRAYEQLLRVSQHAREGSDELRNPELPWARMIPALEKMLAIAHTRCSG